MDSGQILCLDMLEHIQKVNKEILNVGKPFQDNPDAAEALKDLTFDLKIIKLLQTETKTRKHRPGSVFDFLLYYYLIRVDNIEAAENIKEGAQRYMQKFMIEELTLNKGGVR